MACTRVFAAALCAAALSVASVSAQTVTAIEFHHAAFDHYLVSIDPPEIAALDSGFFSGWARTGLSFIVYSNAAPGLNPVCRFFSTSFAPKSSHFFTPSPAECDWVKLNPNWMFESIVFHAPVPAAGDTCLAGTVPVHRLYNDGHGGAPNHRYTADLGVRAAMLAQGWVPEGVTLCSPQITSTVSAAAGVWTGTTSLDETVRAIVLEDGRYFIVYSSPGDTSDSGVWHGSADTSNGQFVTTNGRRYPIAKAEETFDLPSSVALAGTYVAAASLQLVVTDTRGTRSVTATFSPGSTVPPTPAAAAGAFAGFTGHVGGRQLADMTLGPNGALTISNPICGFAGVATPRLAVALFDITIHATRSGCFGGAPITGILEVDAAGRLRGFLPFDVPLDIFYLVANRP